MFQIPFVDFSSYDNILPFTPLERGDLVKLDIEEESYSMVTNVDDNGDECMLDDHRRAPCASLVRILHAKFFTPGATVLGYYQDSADEADFGWYQASVLSHHQRQPEYVDIEWYDGTRETIHFRLLRKWIAIKPSDHVGMSWSSEVGEVVRNTRRSSDASCAIKRLEDDSGYLHLVPCSHLRRWPYSQRLEMDQYNASLGTDELTDLVDDESRGQLQLHHQAYPYGNGNVTSLKSDRNGTMSEVGNRLSNISPVMRDSNVSDQVIHHTCNRRENDNDQGEQFCFK